MLSLLRLRAKLVRKNRTSAPRGRRFSAWRVLPALQVLEDRTAPASFQGLGFLPGWVESRAAAVSADGSVVVGTLGYETGTHAQAFRWTAAGGMVGLGNLPGADDSFGTGVSADGAVVVGRSLGATYEAAFRWTAAGGIVNLGWLSAGDASEASGVSADGAVVVGDSNLYPLANPESFRWTPPGGMVGLGF